MRKLYGLVEAAGFCFKAFGVDIGVRSNSPTALERIRARLPVGVRLERARPVDRLYSFFFPPQTGSQRTRRFHILYGDEQTLARSESEEGVFEEFTSELGHYLARASPTMFFVHAGVVGWKGRAVVIPGRTCTGKTTLVKAFLDCGATYYSDEFAVLDARGHVHAFAKPLGMRKENREEHLPLPVETLGCKIGKQPVPVGAVLLTRYLRGAGWRPERASGGQAVVELLANSFSARANPARAMGILCKAVDGALILRGARGEAQALIRRWAGDFSYGNGKDRP